MTQREQEIMDLHDAGVDRATIAQRLGFKPSYVTQIIQQFDFGHVGSKMAKWERDVRASTQALERAILATGRRHT